MIRELPAARKGILRGPGLAVLFFLSFLYPSARAEEMLDIKTLVGEHPVQGTNVDGKEYEGTVTIRVKGQLLLFQWNIGGNLSYGTGLCDGMSVGVALDSGVALYRVLPQAEGKTLVGLWALEGADKCDQEVITIGNPDITTFPPVEVQSFNGTYHMADKPIATSNADVSVTIFGGDIMKKAIFGTGNDAPESEGIALGESLAMITPQGFLLMGLSQSKSGKPRLSGKFLNKGGELSKVSLVQ